MVTASASSLSAASLKAAIAAGYTTSGALGSPLLPASSFRRPLLLRFLVPQRHIRVMTTPDGMSGSNEHNDRRHAIVTGANTGIGKAIALDLARQGMVVTLACRNKDSGEAAAQEISHTTNNTSIRSMTLDLASLRSVRKFVADYKQLCLPLHVLVNNAGIMACPQGYTEDGFELQLGVNHFGHFLLTSLLIDNLVSSASIEAKSRVVVVSSMAEQFGDIDFGDLNYKGSRVYSSWKAYGQSKLSNCLFSYELAKRSRQLGLPITSNSMHPGVVNTQLIRYALPVVARLGPSLPNFVGNILRIFGLRTPAEGASTAVFLASSPEVENLSGFYFKDCKASTPSSRATDAELASRLWDVSVEMTGAPEPLEIAR